MGSVPQLPSSGSSPWRGGPAQEMTPRPRSERPRSGHLAQNGDTMLGKVANTVGIGDTIAVRSTSVTSGWRLAAGLAITVGVGALALRALDLHGHACDECGHRWRHLGALNFGDPRAHTCARCGVPQWWRLGAHEHGTTSGATA